MTALITSLEPVIILGAILYGVEQCAMILFPTFRKSGMRIEAKLWALASLNTFWIVKIISEL